MSVNPTRHVPRIGNVKEYFKVDMREPYMGNTLIVGVILELNLVDSTVPPKVTITSMQENTRQEMRRISIEEFRKLFNH